MAGPREGYNPKESTNQAPQNSKTRDHLSAARFLKVYSQTLALVQLNGSASQSPCSGSEFPVLARNIAQLKCEVKWERYHHWEHTLRTEGSLSQSSRVGDSKAFLMEVC